MNARDATAHEVQPGAILAGRYLVERQLGEGGMGIVVAARHLQLGHRVAIKYLLARALEDGEAVQRFMREAWAAAQIKSRHVVRVSDVGSLPNGAPFLVMEYLEGEDLAQLLERRKRLAVEEAVELLLQVCEAIAEAHAAGIVHRDLKPSNIFCARDPIDGVTAKVLDFGISKLMHRGLYDLTITTTRTALGSPLYMSPEQMHSAKIVDSRTDIWSLGIILHELLAGEHPFTATSLPELAIRIATEAPRSLRAVRPDVSSGLERTVQRCLEKDRTKRFASIAALAEALAPYASKQDVESATRSRRTRTSHAPPKPSMVSTAVRFASAWMGRDRRLNSARTNPFIVLTVAILALLVAAVIAIWSTRKHDPLRPSAAPVATVSVEAAHAATPPATTPPPIAAHAEATPQPQAAGAPIEHAEASVEPTGRPREVKAKPQRIPARVAASNAVVPAPQRLTPLEEANIVPPTRQLDETQELGGRL